MIDINITIKHKKRINSVTLLSEMFTECSMTCLKTLCSRTCIKSIIMTRYTGEIYVGQYMFAVYCFLLLKGDPKRVHKTLKSYPNVVAWGTLNLHQTQLLHLFQAGSCRSEFTLCLLDTLKTPVVHWWLTRIL